MKSMIKGIVIGSVLFIILGLLGFLGVIAYQVLILNINDSTAMGDMMRSEQVKLWALLFTLISMIFASWVSTRKLHSHIYIVAILLIGIASLVITIGPLKLVMLHGNYLPIAIGGIIGAVLGSKLNKSVHPSVDAPAD